MSDDRSDIFPDDNPEWTVEDFAKARPIAEFPELAAAFAQARAGRPVGSTKPERKVQVALRIDPDIVAAFKADGPGWQSRMNAALRAAMQRKLGAAT